MLETSSELIVLTLVSEKHRELFLSLEKEWSRYFKVNQIFDEPENLANYLDKPVGILFLDATNFEDFHYDYYYRLQQNVPQFLYVSVVNTYNEIDIKLYKSLADHIFCLEAAPEIRKWETIAYLRRYWNTYSKPTTVIYRDIIIDFVKRILIKDNKSITMTNKEFEVFQMLIQSPGQFVSVAKIVDKVWGLEINDSRSVDQVLLKIKKKIGAERFTRDRTLGVKFE